MKRKINEQDALRRARLVLVMLFTGVCLINLSHVAHVSAALDLESVVSFGQSRLPDPLKKSRSEKVRILVVTGGHDFEESSFFQMFEEMKDISYTHLRFKQGAEEMLTPDAARDYDAIVFYDMNQNREPHWKGWLALLEKGKGTVFLHHALGSYPDWDEYGRIVGGRANFDYKRVIEGVPHTTFKHDVAFQVKIADKSHPITNGLKDFDILDETYNRFVVNPDVHVLLTAEHPTSGKIICWTHRYKNSPVVYLQLGHGPTAYENRNFRMLLERSIKWAAGRLSDGQSNNQE